MRADRINALGALELAAEFRARRLSPVEALHSLQERHARINPRINAFYETDWTGALEAARASEARWLRNAPASPLDGVPVSIKDHLPVRGFSTPRGLFHTPRSPATEDCPAAARLREAGLVLFGKTLMPELSVMSFTDSVAFGASRNPWRLELSSGGSSGGATAAVASHLGPLALASDGGGSIRHPSAACGLVGIKPTHGRVPYFPAPTDRTVAGPIARSVADAAAMLSIIARPDGRDWTELAADIRDYATELDAPHEPLRIVYAQGNSIVGIDPEIEACVRRALDALASSGHAVRETDALCEDVSDAHLAQAAPRFSDWLTRLPKDVIDRFPPATIRVLEHFSRMTLADMAKMQDARDRAAVQMLSNFRDADAVVTPTSPRRASRIGEFYPDGDMLGAEARSIGAYTRAFNLVHLPALSVCCGFTSDGMPVGMQIGGPKLSESRLLWLALEVERWRISTYGNRRPDGIDR